jgi:hypothetical protein
MPTYTHSPTLSGQELYMIDSVHHYYWYEQEIQTNVVVGDRERDLI